MPAQKYYNFTSRIALIHPSEPQKSTTFTSKSLFFGISKKMNTTNPDLSKIHRDIISYCKSHADEKIVQKYARYFKGPFHAYGLSQEQIAAKGEDILSISGFSLLSAIELGQMLVKGKMYEETSFALLLLAKFKKQFDDSTFQGIANWFSDGISNWAHTDFLGMEVISVFWIKEIIPLSKAKPWLKAANKFQRRAVPVSLIRLIKKNPQIIPEIIKFPEVLMLDQEREVHQGMGWFLREAWKKDPKPVEEMLLKYKDTAARLIIQYATEKMTHEQKVRFKRSKPG